MNSYRIINGIIVLKDQLLFDRHVIVKDNRIIDITDAPQKYRELETIDAQGNYISPGFVELHIHGCSHYGFDLLEQLNIEEIVEFLKRRGVNTFVPTFQCNREVIRNFAKRAGGSEILKKAIPGIYIEGPFINEQKKGGISADYITRPDIHVLKEIIKESNGLLKLMTIAPELEGNKAVFNELIENHIIPCLGHSNAEIKDTSIANDYQVNITHLFNAMSPVSHKKSGLAMLPFINRDVFFELNGDGVHVSDEVIMMCYNALNKDRCILVSDAVISAGLEHGEYNSYGRTVISGKNGVRYREDNGLMGSNLLINDILKRFIKLTGAPLYEGIRFVSYNPCQLLGISDRKGSI